MTTTTPGALTQQGTSTILRTERTGWTGWIAFAGVIMIIGGALAAMQGLVAILNKSWAVWSNSNDLAASLATWGWIHLILGALVVLAGIGVFAGSVLARTVGVVLAAVSIATNFLFMPAYPVWALAIMVVDVLVIWALVVHGGEMREV